jgi:hypothetical protein
LPLFRPATGRVQAKGVRSAPNTVLQPWLQTELEAILAGMPPVTTPEAERPAAARWVTWLGHEPREALPPLRVIRIWDHLAGHLSWTSVRWLFRHGIMPLYTPLAGSWWNMAESVQRIFVRRALAGPQPETATEVIQWLEDTVAGWNVAPTPFTWGGRRQARRQRARQRRLGGSAATLSASQAFAA